ncbi:MAG: aminotransferase class V-fold PLP-dependent enzyme, partial [Pontibacterium sp.]
ITRFGVVDLDALATLLSPKTRLVAVTHVSNVLGVENPVEDICRLAKSVGAKVLIDGAQALAHHSVDVSQLGCDFYVFSGHKMYGPTGIGALWAPEALLNDLPPWHGGGEMIKKVSFSGTTYNSLPFKFEAGTPNISGAIALATAAKWLANQSVDAIRQHEQSLAQQALEACHQINAFKRIGTPSQDVSLFSFAMSNCHANDVATLLDQQGIAVRSGHHCAMPLMETLKVPGTLRVSFACYNTQDDVDAFVCALRDAYQQLADLTPIISTGTPKNQSDSYAHHQTVAGAFSTSLPPTLTFEAVKAQLNQRKDWNSRYREIMQLGKQLPSLDDRYKTDEFKVTGCESNTWLITKQQADGIYIHIDSEARIIRGLGALILVALNNKSMSMDTISSIESWFKQLNLDTHLSPSRSNGLAGIIFAISKALPESLDS